MDPLLAACREAPDDDAPRLVWADAVGGERGELVVIECDLARGGLSPRETAARRRRRRELLAAHGVAWSGLRGLATRCTFHRGLVDAAYIEIPTFLARAAEIFAAAPLLASLSGGGLSGTIVVGRKRVRRGPDTLGLLAELVGSPAFDRIEALGLSDVGDTVERDSDDPYSWEGREEEAVALLAVRGALAALRGFQIGGLRRAGLEALATADLSALERLGLRNSVFGAGSAQLLAAALSRMPALRVLTLDGGALLEGVAATLPPALAGLRLTRGDDGALAALAASPAAAGVEQLELVDGRIEREPAPLAALPRLRSLSLAGTSFGSAGYMASTRAVIEKLAALSLPALRELRIPWLAAEHVRTLVAAFGAQLHLCIVHDATVSPALAEELRAGVAGELVVEPHRAESHLIRRGLTPLDQLVIEIIDSRT